MKTIHQSEIPYAAAQMMTVEMISDLLVATDASELGQKLTEQLRELAGARTVLLIGHHGKTGEHELLHATPPRRAALFPATALHLCCPECTPDPLPRRPEEMSVGDPFREVLLTAGVESVLRFPLRAGGKLVGALLLLDLPDLERIDDTAEVIGLLSPLLAMALRNSLDRQRIERQSRQLEKQAAELEQRVSERTAELATANKSLIASRLAALNMMEDALSARRRAEEFTVALQREVAERKRAEEQIHHLHEELQRHADELEHRVRDRTAQLEASNKELEAFSYSVSHDLRSPLRGIDGWGQALLEDFGDKLGADGRQLLERQRAATQRMGILIDDLLRLSRLTRQPLERTTVDMGELTRKAWKEVSQAQPSTKAELVVGELSECQADASLLTQVFVNLLGNALKFSGSHAHPRIEVGCQTGGDGECVYYVKDNGAGFDMRYANKLFGAFQRLHSVQEFSGTGIGLAITQRVIRRHGGRIWAESAVGHGATFYFTIPGGYIDEL